MNNNNHALIQQQARMQEKMHQEIEATFQKFCDAFMDKFIESDPDSEEFKSFIKQITGKWKTYCHVKRLTLPAFSVLDKHIESVLKAYKEQPDPEQPETSKHVILTPNGDNAQTEGGVGQNVATP